MSMDTPSDRLVMMANQIGKFFGPQRQGDPVAAIADHLQKFWDPRMRAAIVAHFEKGGEGLEELGPPSGWPAQGDEQAKLRSSSGIGFMRKCPDKPGLFREAPTVKKSQQPEFMLTFEGSGNKAPKRRGTDEPFLPIAWSRAKAR